MIRDLLTVAIGVSLLGYSVIVLFRGEVNFTMLYFFNDRATRAENPSTFWTIIIVWIVLGIFLSIFGIRNIIDRRDGLNMDHPPAIRRMEKKWSQSPKPHCGNLHSTSLAG